MVRDKEKRKAEQEWQKQEGTIVSVRQSSFLLFSAVQSCITKMYFKIVVLSVVLACMCVLLHIVPINIQQFASLSGVSQI